MGDDMTDENLAYIESQYVLLRITAKKFRENGNKFVSSCHKKQHNRILRRIKFAFGDSA